MDIEKQREIVRLWNCMRRVEGPVAEEIRIQILASFSEQTVGDRKTARPAGNVRAMRQPASLRVSA